MDGHAHLRRLLMNGARVDERVVDHIMKSMGLDSISGFASMFSQQDYHTGVQAEILGHTALKDDVIQRGRLRTAWELARAVFSQALAQTRDMEDVVLSAPLPAEVQQNEILIFRQFYNLQLDPELLPAVALLARLYKKFQKRSSCVVPLEKVETQAQIVPLPDVSRKRKHGADLAITISGAEAVPGTDVRGPMQVLRALRVCVLACALHARPRWRARQSRRQACGTPTCPRCSATWSGATRPLVAPGLHERWRDLLACQL